MTHVSVIIPAYNARDFIADAVDSALAQTVKSVDIIVVDDGSTDGTGDVLSRFGAAIRVVRQPNRGVAVSRNLGIAEARGRYVAFLDADDIWEPRKIEEQLDAISSTSSGYGACSTRFLVVDEQLRPVEVFGTARRMSTLSELLMFGNTIGTPSTVLCDRALFQQVGGFDPALSQCADWDMWIRLAAVTDFIRLDNVLVRYRKHDRSMSRDVALLERDSRIVLDKAFAMPDLPPALRRLRRRLIARNYMVVAGSYFRIGAWRDFLRCAARAVALAPAQMAYLAQFPLRHTAHRKAAADA